MSSDATVAESAAHRVVSRRRRLRRAAGRRAAASAPVDITLVDRRNFHLFQPLLYQVATGALSPGEIASPLRAILKRKRNVRVLLAEVAGFDLDARARWSSGSGRRRRRRTRCPTTR